MEKEKRIEEMAKEISTVLFCDCLLNNGGRCYDCECNKKETKEYDCQSYLVAKKQFEQGYRKQEDILHEWVERETAYLNEIAELKKELKKELAEHEEFTKKAKAEIERLTEEFDYASETIVMERKRRERQNAESDRVIADLEKQVDELKEQFLSTCENCYLKKDIELIRYQKEDLYFQNKNLQTYIDNHEPIWKRNAEQAVKDTAKEVADKIQELLDTPFEGKTEKQEYQRKGMEEGLRMALEICKEITEGKNG